MSIVVDFFVELFEEVDVYYLSCWQKFVFGLMMLIFLIFVVMIVVFLVFEFSLFVIVDNVCNVVNDVLVLFVIFVGMMYVIIMVGIDFLVGVVFVFFGVIVVWLMNVVGGNGWGMILIGLVGVIVVGFVWGIFNGMLIMCLCVFLLIVMFGSFGMVQGVVLLIIGGIDECIVLIKFVDIIGIGWLFGQVFYIVIIVVVVVFVFGVFL